MPLQQVEEEEAQAVGGRLVERDEGLVEQQQAGPHHESPGEGRPPRHAERQARGEHFVRRLELDLGEGGGNPRRRIGRGGQDEAQIVGHRAPRQEARLLEDVAEPRARRELQAARKVRHQTGHDVEQRGLAATGRADDREALARLDLQPDVGQGDLGRGATHRGEAVLAQFEAQRRHWPALRSIGCRMPHSITWTTMMNDSA